MLVEAEAIRIVKPAFSQLKKPIFVVASVLNFYFFSIESWLSISIWSGNMFSIFIVAATLTVVAPLVEVVSRFIVEAAIFHDKKPIFVKVPLLFVF